MMNRRDTTGNYIVIKALYSCLLFFQLDTKTDHYLPSKISVGLGTSMDNIQKEVKIDIHRTQATVPLFNECYVHYPVLVIYIHKCQASGINCRVRYLSFTQSTCECCWCCWFVLCVGLSCALWMYAGGGWLFAFDVLLA